jgi:hypothetical protein
MSVFLRGQIMRVMHGHKSDCSDLLAGEGEE